MVVQFSSLCGFVVHLLISTNCHLFIIVTLNCNWKSIVSKLKSIFYGAIIVINTNDNVDNDCSAIFRKWNREHFVL